MGMYDHVRLNNVIFGDDQGHIGQTKDLQEWPTMDDYEINPEGRLIHIEVNYEDQSDPNAKPGSLESFLGCMTPVPTGEITDLNFHGFVWVWGKGAAHQWCCKFTDGNLVSIEKITR